MLALVFALILALVPVAQAASADEAAPAAEAAESLFGLPVPPGTCQVGCYFNDTECSTAHPGMYHTASDYVPNDGAPKDILATADGTVAAMFSINDPGSASHGMGNAIILHHLLPSGVEVFSLYGHLDHLDHDFKVGDKVVKGEKIAVMGGSGFGQLTYWGKHVHFEIKSAAIMGNPGDPAPGPSTGLYEGYMPTPAENWGFFDPADFVGKAAFVPLEQDVTPATPSAADPAPSSSGGGGCFIATAAWGSKAAGQVVCLRRVRDERLAETCAGRRFIGCYYRFSPPAARFLSTSPALRGMVRTALWPVFWAGYAWLRLGCAAGLLGLLALGWLTGGLWMPRRRLRA
jgi:hypothetical protein